MHSIIESAINNEALSERYKKEIATSLDAAKKYREKINPVESSLPPKDIGYIKNKITSEQPYAKSMGHPLTAKRDQTA